MAEPTRIFGWASDVVGNVLELAEDRRRAWFVSLAGVLATVLCWWIAIVVSVPAQEVLDRSDRIGVLIGLAFLLVVIAGPFVAAFAALQAISPKPASAAETEPAFMAHSPVLAESDRRRRIGLASALVAVINASLLYTTTGGLS